MDPAVEARQFHGYSMLPPPESVTDANPDSTTSSSTTTSSASSKTTGKGLTGTGTSVYATSTPSIPTSTSVPSSDFTFVELFDKSESAYYSIHEDQFLNASFSSLCPSGNCITDCLDYPRLFSAVPSGIDQDVSTYGRPDANNKLEVTLFGVCSNLGNATALALSQSPASGIHGVFAAPNGSASITDQITRVASTIASCFEATCGQTRDPATCHTSCASAQLLQAGAEGSSLNIGRNMLACASMLCENTCGLPYANQDVLGIGVLVSYYVQAILVLLLAVGLVGFVAWGILRKTDDQPHVHGKLRKPLESFVTAQAYFGVSATIASFVMQPATVDPLNGYALLSVSISGFLPVVFTLMLLHSHGVRSWFTTILVFISWLLSTIVFFIIFKNLSNSESNQAVFDEGLDQLFSTPSCGGQSAMSLCQQLRGTNPLAYLTGFFNQSSIPNIKTVPLLWGWTTLILLTLVARQAFGLGPQPSDDEKDHHDASKPKPTYHPSLLAKTSFVLATIIFSLCLGYQFVMINTYRLMDVIDFDGWSFGQIVAVLFWVPPALEVMHSLSEKGQKAESTTSSHADATKGLTTFASSAYAPLASPTPYASYYPDQVYNDQQYYQYSGDGSMMVTDQAGNWVRQRPQAAGYSSHDGYQYAAPDPASNHQPWQ